MRELSLGQLVLSCAGRDSGRFMIVVKILDSNYVYVADGTLRKIENPKKKKIKHLKVLNKKSDYIAEKLQNKRKVYNDEIKRALEELADVGLEETSSQI
ncbi:MAG TPA: RNA-binding protein [Thermoanaerobacterales bacterium]|nr:RNA-binding protein [Thermoanaerobacterales bacterium]